MVKPREAANNNWFFDKIFGDDDFIAAGQLVIPPKGLKPSKAAKDNTYVKFAILLSTTVGANYYLRQVFYVIDGAVNFKILKSQSVQG